MPPGAGWLGPLTSGGTPEAAALDPSRWQLWWNYNRDQYLQLGRFLSGVSSSSSNAARPSAEDVRRQIVPALEGVLRKGGRTNVLRGSLVSFARLEAEYGRVGLGLDHYVRHYLKSGGPDGQEAAIVALGVRGDAASVPLLRGLLLDEEIGRQSIGGLPVSARLRAFAAYSLALVADKTEDEEHRRPIADALLTALSADHSTTRETQVAAAVSLGLVPLRFCGDDPERLAGHEAEGARHLCGGVQLNYALEAFRNAELDSWLRAHLAPAIGRLGREAPEAFRTAVADELVTAARGKKTPDEIRQGVAIGLGLFADADQDEPDEAARGAIERLVKKGDPLAQRFALMSLAQASGRPGSGDGADKTLEESRALLLKRLAHGRGGVEPWAALALAVQGHEQGRNAGVISSDLANAIRHQLTQTRSDDLASACVLALGVLRDQDSADEVLSRFERSEDPLFRAYASLTLGLVSAREAGDPLREALDGDETPEVGLELAIGLRLLGDAAVQASMVDRLRNAENEADRVATASALGLIGDRRSVEPLAAVVRDVDEEASVRTAAALALGQVCDGDRVAWSTPFSSDVNYSILTWTLASPFGDGTGLLDIR
ncbi:MAG: HEAT repeat domain-containing protein [Planctomycetota bacterium]